MKSDKRTDFSLRTARVAERIDCLAQISENPHGLTRTFASAAAAKANERVLNWAKDAGLNGYADHIGNVRIRSKTHDPSKKVFVMGSHLDSVVQAGKYDGPLGFLIALDILENLEKTPGERPFNLEVVGFSDEEGVRYHTTFLGSSVLAGSFDPRWADRPDEAGVPMKDAITNFGGDLSRLAEDRIPPGQFLGYFEVHIEQGPVLQAGNLALGIVKNIAAQVRAELVFEGMAGHAGTSPMGLRTDALCGAAEFILGTEQFGLQNRDSLVATVGKCKVNPNAANVIPGETRLSLDVRSADQARLTAAVTELRKVADRIAAKRGLRLQWQIVQETSPVFCDQTLCAKLEQSLLTFDHPVVFLTSGAGHDAVVLSKVAPVAMLFVRCKDGISHHPDEFASPEDIEAAIEVSDHFIRQLFLTHE